MSVLTPAVKHKLCDNSCMQCIWTLWVGELMFQGPESPVWACDWLQAEWVVVHDVFIKQKDSFIWTFPQRNPSGDGVFWHSGHDLFSLLFLLLRCILYLWTCVLFVKRQTELAAYVCLMSGMRPVCNHWSVISSFMYIRLDHTNHRRRYDEVWLHILL